MLSIVNRLGFLPNAPFRKLDMIPSSGEMGEQSLLIWARYKDLVSITEH
jgi:hypothetical protein